MRNTLFIVAIPIFMVGKKLICIIFFKQRQSINWIKLWKYSNKWALIKKICNISLTYSETQIVNLKLGSSGHQKPK